MSSSFGKLDALQLIHNAGLHGVPFRTQDLRVAAGLGSYAPESQVIAQVMGELRNDRAIEQLDQRRRNGTFRIKNMTLVEARMRQERALTPRPPRAIGPKTPAPHQPVPPVTSLREIGLRLVSIENKLNQLLEKQRLPRAS